VCVNVFGRMGCVCRVFLCVCLGVGVCVCLK
jgi:hypothetical protein